MIEISAYKQSMTPSPVTARVASLSSWLVLLLLCTLTSACEHKHKPEQSWEVAVKGIYAGAFTPDSKMSLIGSITHGASLWRVSDNERLFNWNHKQGTNTNVIAAAFSPEGNFAFTADHQTMVLWSTSSGKALTFWTAPNEVLAVDLTPEANFALLGLADHSVVLYDVKRGGIKRTFYHKNRVRSVKLSADGKLAVSGSEDETAKLWNVNDGKLIHSWQHSNEVRLVGISPKGDKAVSVSKYDKAVVWDANTGAPIGEIPLQAHQLRRGLTFTSVVFSRDGELLLTGNSDRTVQLWETKTLRELQSWELPKRDAWKPTSASVVALSFSESPDHFYAIASNGFIHRLQRNP